MRKFSLANIFLLLLALSACRQSPESMLIQAEQYVANGEYNEATVVLKSILMNNSDDQAARAMLADMQLNRGNFLDAVKNFERIDNEHIKIHIDNYIAALALSEELNNTIKLYNVNLESVSDKAKAYALYAAFSLNDTDAILSIYETIGEGSYASLAQSFIAFRNRSIDKAIQLTQKAIFEDPNNLEAYWFNGLYHESKGDFDSAFSAFKTYNQTRKNDLRAYYYLAVNALASGNKEEAEKYAQILTQNVNNHPTGNYILGLMALRDQGDAAQANMHAKNAINSSNIRKSAQLISGISGYVSGSYETAFQDLYALTASTSRNHPSYAFLLITSASMEDDDALKQVLAERFNNEEIDIPGFLSNSAMRLAQNEDTKYMATILYDSLTRLYPDPLASVIAQNLLAESLGKKPLSTLDQQLIKFPENEKLTVLSIYQHLKNENIEEAEKLLSKVDDEAVRDHIRVNIAFIEKKYEHAFNIAKNLLSEGKGVGATLNIALLAAEKSASPPDLSELRAILDNQNLNLFPLITKIYIQSRVPKDLEWLTQNLNSQSIIVKAYLAKSFNESQSFSDAIKLVPDNYQHDINDPITKLYLSSLLAEKDYQTARSFLKKWAKQSDSQAAFEALTRLLVAQRDYKAVIELIEPRFKKNQASETMQRALLRAYLSTGDRENSHDLLQTLIDDNPFDGDLIYQMSRLEELKGNHELRESLLEKAYKVSPTEKIVLNYAYDMLRKGNLTNAIALLKAHITEYQKHGNAMLLYASLIVDKNPIEALQAYLYVPANILQQNANALNNVAYLLSEQGNHSQAKTYIDKAIKMEPDNISFIDTRNVVYKALEDKT